MVAQPLRFQKHIRGLTLPVLSCICFALLISCGGKKKRIKLPPPTPARMGWTERGLASWYGHPYHGRRTSNGEVYDMNKLTAAHKSLPFNTWVRVTNLDNKERVEVRINDRGPFIKGRIIDLSREGAKQIEMIGPGTARVRIRVVATPSMTYKGRKPSAATRSKRPAPIEPPDSIEPSDSIEASAPNAPPAAVELPAAPSSQPRPTSEPTVISETESAQSPCSAGSFHGVQVGSFQDIENAERMQGKIADRYGFARIDVRESAIGTLYRVIAGRFASRQGAGDLERRLRQDGIDGFVTAFTMDNPPDCL
jgi:rare lipoprotein A